ncbi:hypothetical protein ACOSQ2_003263 [Xanthoceras sorbifolium]
MRFEEYSLLWTPSCRALLLYSRGSGLRVTEEAKCPQSGSTFVNYTYKMLARAFACLSFRFRVSSLIHDGRLYLLKTMTMIQGGPKWELSYN